jgi:hypothetical protein
MDEQDFYRFLEIPSGTRRLPLVGLSRERAPEAPRATPGSVGRKMSRTPPLMSSTATGAAGIIIARAAIGCFAGELLIG